MLIDQCTLKGWTTGLEFVDKKKRSARTRAWESDKVWTLEIRDAGDLVAKVSSEEQGALAFQQLGLLGAAALARSGRA